MITLFLYKSLTSIKVLLVNLNTLLSSAKTSQHLSLPTPIHRYRSYDNFNNICKIFSGLIRQYGTNSKLELKEF
jgi:hypothetical protein